MATMVRQKLEANRSIQLPMQVAEAQTLRPLLCFSHAAGRKAASEAALLDSNEHACETWYLSDYLKYHTSRAAF